MIRPCIIMGAPVYLSRSSNITDGIKTFNIHPPPRGYNANSTQIPHTVNYNIRRRLLFPPSPSSIYALNKPPSPLVSRTSSSSSPPLPLLLLLPQFSDDILAHRTQTRPSYTDSPILGTDLDIRKTPQDLRFAFLNPLRLDLAGTCRHLHPGFWDHGSF